MDRNSHVRRTSDRRHRDVTAPVGRRSGRAFFQWAPSRLFPEDGDSAFPASAHWPRRPSRVLWSDPRRGKRPTCLTTGAGGYLPLSIEYDTLDFASSSSARSFPEFLARVRAGDESAAHDLIRQYEPALRMEVRLRLGDPKLRQLLEPSDICQSVLGSFFARVTAGQFDLNSPRQLLALLLSMARNKVAQQARRQQARRRDCRRGVHLDEKTMELVSPEPGPMRVIIGRDLHAAFLRRLSDEERQMARLRSEGFEWAAIAAEIGGTAQGRRKQLARAVDRVSRELGLIEMGDV